jgi:hypothetical protein
MILTLDDIARMCVVLYASADAPSPRIFFSVSAWKSPCPRSAVAWTLYQVREAD